jgi:hypothetical protein
MSLRSPRRGEAASDTAEESIEGQFGIDIATLMQRQHRLFPELSVPRLLHTLCTQLRLHGATTSEGVFRVPGRASVVDALKRELNRSSASSDLTRVFADTPGTDVNALATLLKLWFRELPEPIVPHALYDVAVRGFSPQHEHADDPVSRALAIFRELAPHSRRVLRFTFRFLDEFILSDVSASATRMTEDTIAMVFCPAFMSSPSTNTTEIAMLAHSERAFILALMEGLRQLELEEHLELYAPAALAANVDKRASRGRANALTATDDTTRAPLSGELPPFAPQPRNDV